jgi:hypothetical protein
MYIHLYNLHQYTLLIQFFCFTEVSKYPCGDCSAILATREELKRHQAFSCTRNMIPTNGQLSDEESRRYGISAMISIHLYSGDMTWALFWQYYFLYIYFNTHGLSTKENTSYTPDLICIYCYSIQYKYKNKWLQFWKGSLNSDGQQFHQSEEQNEQSPLTSRRWKCKSQFGAGTELWRG